MIGDIAEPGPPNDDLRQEPFRTNGAQARTTMSANILVVTWEGGGNVPPAMALAERLGARGLRVRVSAPESMRAVVDAAGAELVPWRNVRSVPPTTSHEASWPQIDAILNGPAMVEELQAIYRADPIDGIVVDSMSGAGLAVAERLGLPTAVLVHTLYRPYTGWGPNVVNIRRDARDRRPGATDGGPVRRPRARPFDSRARARPARVRPG